MISTYTVIREVDPRDLPRVYEIEQLSFGKHAYPFELFLIYYFLFKELFLVAEFLDLVIGYVIGSVEEKGLLGHVLSIAVHPLYRGYGIGKRLMRELEERFRDRGVKRIYLEVSVDNTIALNLYRRLGYVVKKRIKGYYGDSDAYVMEKTIAR